MNKFVFSCVLSILVCAGIDRAGAAPMAIVVNCIDSISPPPNTQCFNHTLNQPFTFWVVIVDDTVSDASNISKNYRGSIHFSSDDLTAELPPYYTFTADDAGIHAFTATFHTMTTADIPSLQTITASDAANNLSSMGGFFISPATPQAALPAPTLDGIELAVLGGALGLAASFSLYRFK
jgi:hypothetical protein